MRNEVHLDVRKITGSDNLVGKTGGQRDLPKFLNAVMAIPEGSTVILDWSGVELATASYFGATVLPLLQMSISGHLDRYFLLANVDSNYLDDLKLVVEYNNLVVLTADMDRKGAISGVRVIGTLEPAYSETLDAVSASQSASAATLHNSQNSKKSKIGKSGWANRLAYLSELRLVKKQRVGRQFVFELIFQGGQSGC